ncbi:N-acetylmannosamine-6-phosphate 2-epimerase [Antrihabitans cavernicola]|uniref:Putative N-acetylmannosamine-6-phosphate 2-epimerase n=1 Tax=Antrihabitans cavernicola TaxID=2495913 RepID=A0A5A7S664_9NOCA|nr:N-acetylmannosamine-6-phosphate 2-epimerase [Spelaeibacter cavernicola]KAA0021610.1 N-acetylmannosamine-6-phosphate 2-epimerase [Spelaeibacter cavernicola]
MNPLIASLRGGLIVSCQAYPGEPLRHPETMAQMAEAVVAGGAVAVRAQGLADCALIKQRVSVPVIGLWKDGKDGVFITPTLQHAIAVRNCGVDVVALDGTRRQRPDGLTFADTVERLRAAGPVVVMADCGSLADARAARDAGVDAIGTTLAGYSGDRPKSDGPDLDLLADIVSAVPDVPIIAEGRVHTPEQARQALEAGAHAVVVGTAITHPTTITGWFVGRL